MSAAETLPLRIFVIENDVDTLKYCRMYLEGMGHVVYQAQAVADALSLIPESHCDVLISDIGLEDGTGWELLRRLRRSNTRPGVCDRHQWFRSNCRSSDE